MLSNKLSVVYVDKITPMDETRTNYIMYKCLLIITAIDLLVMWDESKDSKSVFYRIL